MLKSISCTVVNLIPKISSPSTMKDYKPIACCTTLHKIITKILATRLKMVIISSSQIAFIEGRSIMDYILLSNKLLKWYNSKV